jgi:hypothetical protein
LVCVTGEGLVGFSSFPYFWCQVYAISSVSVRDAPLSRVHHRLPILLSPASAVRVNGDRSWPSHAWVLFCLDWRDGHAPPFLAVQGWRRRLWWPICCRVTPRTTRVLHKSIFFRRRQGPLLPTWFELAVRCVCAFLCCYVQSIYVWHKSYWNFFVRGA